MSVVVPVYNPGDYLGPCLESVLAQTMSDFEIIVVDDGGTEDISRLPALRDSRVRVVRQSNAGVAIARNIGVLEAEAHLIAFLDQDDTWHPKKLELQLGVVERNPGAAAFHSGFEWVWPDRRVPAPVTEEVTYRGLLSTQMICTSTALVSRRRLIAVGGFNPLLRTVDDYDLFLRLAMGGEPIRAASEILVSYTYHESNASYDYVAGARGRRRVIEQHLERARAVGDREAELACRRGLKRTAEMYGLQALDALRADLHAHRFGRLPRRAAEVTRIDPLRLVHATATSVRVHTIDRRRPDAPSR